MHLFVCLQRAVFTGYALSYIEGVVLETWPLELYAHDCIGCFSVYTVVGYTQD